MAFLVHLRRLILMIPFVLFMTESSIRWRSKKSNNSKKLKKINKSMK